MVILILGGFITFITLLYGGYWCLIPLALTILGALLPIEGYEERKCAYEIQLIKLQLPKLTTSKYYVVVNGRKAKCAYDNSEAYELEGTAYEELNISGNIKIYEDETCKKPILKKYITKPSREFFSCCPFSISEYIFYVPKGSVYNENAKNKSAKITEEHNIIV